jgi:DNA polymerase III delta prime subunit
MEFITQEEATQMRNHPIWVERYRPETLDEYIGNDSVKEKFKIYIEKQDIPHILFFGPAGTGKTSLAKILAKNINCDRLYVNASDENRVDDVRIKLKNFAVGAGFKPLKVVILDESDRLTPDAQGALRNMMETYSLHTRFILTCNYVEKIIDPIVSRCQTFEIKPLNKVDIAKKLVSILNKEKVAFSKEDLKFIVETYYPDIRKVINFAQQSNVNGTIKIVKENAIDIDFYNKIIEVLKNPSNAEASVNEVRQLICSHATPDSLEPAFRYLLDHVEEYAKGKESVVILRLAEGLKDSSALISKVRDIPFLAAIYNILNDLSE